MPLPKFQEELPAGPGTVLALMKFHIPEYESWFASVIEPLVGEFGKCIRITNGLDDWRAEMRRIAHRADAVLVDLSHDLTTELSVNVVWELTQLYREMLDRKRRDAVKRDRVLCFSRSLDKKESRSDRDPAFIWSAEVNPSWVPLKKRSLNIDDLLGFRIRKYNPSDFASVQGLTEWLRDNLSVLVQGVTAPLTDAALRQRAQEVSKQSQPTPLELKLLQAIADLDIDGSWKMIRDGPPPSVEMLDLVGCLLTAVSVTRAINYVGYWPLVKQVISVSKILREHFFKLLQTKHLRQQNPVTTNFRENLWLSLRQAKLSLAEDSQLRELAKLELDPGVRGVADSVLMGFLRDGGRQEAQSQSIMGFYGVEEP